MVFSTHRSVEHCSLGPGEQVYAGMVVGENPRAEDMEVNVCKKKSLPTHVLQDQMMLSSFHLQR